MLQELADEGGNQGLKMNTSKTKVMMETDTLYLGWIYSTRDKNQDKEDQRRITAGWTTFAKHRDILKGTIGTCLKRQIYNSCVLPAMTCIAETCNPSKEQTSSHTNKAGKEYVKHHVPGKKNKHLGKRKDQGYRRD